MATKFTNQLQPTNSTAAFFRAWCTFVRDVFLLGWVQTADTGQMDFATVSAPGAANTVMGYAIFRMDDALQGASPVYAKLEFGSGSVTNEPRITFTLGTGSNGSGTISGAFLTSYVVENASNGTGQTNIFSHGSASSSHAAVSLFVHATSSFVLTFSVERARDVNGAEVGTHVVFLDSGTVAIARNSRYLIRAGGTQPTAQTAFTSIVCTSVANAGTHTEYAALENVSFGLVLPISGTTLAANRPEPAALGYIITPDNFTTIDAVLIVYIYGEPHVYKRLNVVRPGVGGNANVSAYVAWQRYE